MCITFWIEDEVRIRDSSIIFVFPNQTSNDRGPIADRWMLKFLVFLEYVGFDLAIWKHGYSLYDANMIQSFPILMSIIRCPFNLSSHFM